MKLGNFLLAWFVLKIKFLTTYFSIKNIIKAFVGSFLLANFIYLSIFENIFLDFLSPFLTLAGIYTIIRLPRPAWFFAGFFTGILWFYWISFSFIYYDLAWLMPLVIIGVAVVYGLIFLAASWPSFVALRAVLLLIFSYIAPFGFNWLNFEAMLVPGIFEPNIRGIALFFITAIVLAELRGFLKFIIVFACLVGALKFQSTDAFKLPFDLELAQTNVEQHDKWQTSLRHSLINDALELINKAIASQKPVIALPESAFPTFLSHEKALVDELKALSSKITIITGALAYENGKNFNSTFLFQNGEMSRFDKLVLVPFGEEIPLPKFAKNFINKLFFDGASDFVTAKSVSDYEINGIKIRNAICYEATTKELYMGEFDVMFAISNNGWFLHKNLPSTQPVLQRILLKYYATKYSKTIYHSVNGSRSEIIAPKQSIFKDKFAF